MGGHPDCPYVIKRHSWYLKVLNMFFIFKPVFLFSKIVSEIAKDKTTESDSEDQEKKSKKQQESSMP